MKRIELIICFMVSVSIQSCIRVTPLPSSVTLPADNLTGVTEIPSMQVTSFEEYGYDKNCLEINQELLPSELATSKIIFENREKLNERYLPGLILFDLTTLEKTIINNSDEHFLDIRESPDKTKIVYRLVKDGVSPDALVILTSNYQSQKITDWKSEWNGILGWSDNNHIVIARNENLEFSDSVDKPPKLIILDISTLNQKDQISNFPDLYDFHPLPSWNGYGPVIYNSSFNKAIYMKWTDETKSTYGYALWDVKNNKELTFREIVWSPIPQWSPDESYFVTTGLIDTSPKDLFAVYENGQTKRLTNFDNYFQSAEVYNFSWSPDGHFLAILLIEQSDSKEANLVLLDIATGILTDFCIPVTIYGDLYTNTFVPLWSPDSKQIIIQDWYTVGHRRILLINILDNYAIELIEDVEPQAWLK